MASRGKPGGNAGASSSAGRRAPITRPRRAGAGNPGHARARGPEPQGGADDGAKSHVHATYQRIYQVVHCIPPGRVATYGQVAELAGIPGAARVVGAAMRTSLAGAGVPWQRVVGKRARATAGVSILDPVGAAMQRSLLEAEGVVFSASGGIALRTHGWLPVDDGRDARGPATRRQPLGKRARGRRMR